MVTIIQLLQMVFMIGKILFSLINLGDAIDIILLRLVNFCNDSSLTSSILLANFVKIRSRRHRSINPILGIITAVLLTTGKNVARENYGDMVQNPPLYTGHNNPE